jgi:hypothetical protein
MNSWLLTWPSQQKVALTHEVVKTLVMQDEQSKGLVKNMDQWWQTWFFVGHRPQGVAEWAGGTTRGVRLASMKL